MKIVWMVYTSGIPQVWLRYAWGMGAVWKPYESHM